MLEIFETTLVNRYVPNPFDNQTYLIIILHPLILLLKEYSLDSQGECSLVYLAYRMVVDVK